MTLSDVKSQLIAEIRAGLEELLKTDMLAESEKVAVAQEIRQIIEAAKREEARQ